MNGDKLFWELNELEQMHIELTNACNAACPMCRREVNPNFDKEKHLTSLSLKQITEKCNHHTTHNNQAYQNHNNDTTTHNVINHLHLVCLPLNV